MAKLGYQPNTVRVEISKLITHCTYKMTFGRFLDYIKKTITWQVSKLCSLLLNWCLVTSFLS